MEINAPDGASDRTNISKQKRLADVLLETDREFEYIVMGNVDRGSVERLVLPSMTEAVIGTHEIPVLLVPV
ncbi:MAG: nucleotide-binding universal stress UspA family protein [Haloarculaceae archaeon]